MDKEKETRTFFGHQSPAMAELSEQISRSLSESPLAPEEKMALMMKRCISLFGIMKTDTAEMKVSDGRTLKLTREKIPSRFH
ncbi:hypothetical protein ACUNEV_21775 [Serratia sp. IR-2025]